MSQRIVITGLGALTPIGLNIEDFWASLLDGKSGAAPITRFDTTAFKTKFACELKGFHVEEHLNKKEIRQYEPVTQYALVAVGQALKDAGLNDENIDSENTGVIWGTGNGGMQTMDEELGKLFRSDYQDKPSPYFMPKILINMASGIISIKYGLRGICHTTVSACASANTAIIEAANYIKLGKADVMICGGSEAPITASLVSGFNSLKALSTNNENPESASRPFDADRNGFVMGEGAGAFILETYEHATARGAKIYAEISGDGMTSDAHHLTATHPEGDGAYRAMKEAISSAGIKAGQVSYVNAHATSTKLGDLSEAKAIGRLFGKDVLVGATKSMTGHLLGAAGALEAIASVLSIHHNKIPPMVNLDQPDENISELIKIAPDSVTDMEVNHVISNNFGFGGHNASVLFSKVS
ncbi:MAG: beta-ketoacyl-ACP synthase II [Cyclobacteriaceae bacterium]